MTVSGDTVSTDLLAQAWHELDLSRTASPVMGHINSRTLRDSILGHKITNRFFPISINARITILDTLAATDGRLISKASGYDIDTTKATPFISRNALMSALSQQEFVTNTAYAFTVSDKYIYTNDRIGISSIQLIEPVNGINITKSPGSSGSITFSYEGKFDIQVKTTYTDHSTLINIQTIELRNPPPDDPCKRQRHIVASDIPFQGDGEAFGTTSLGAYYIYYHKDANGNCEKLLKKPIIICDGFDPEDKHDIARLEEYFEFRDMNNIIVQSIDKMTEQGFDVIMLNFPVLGDKDQLESRSDVRTSLNTTISANMRDGGSDFIERNAMLMVKLIQQVNDSLVVNGSSEQLCILGPSMGGLITKYALAYMEQQHAKAVPKMNHNTRLWCSFDSPHHGANIPIGNMVGLVQMAERANSEGAENKFRIKLSNPAAREQLVTQQP